VNGSARAAFAIVLLRLGAPETPAATFEIEVRERGGSALPGRKVCARLERTWGWSRTDVTCSETDGAGRASIANLPSGSFSLYVDSPQDADLVPTLQNPWEAGSRATIREESERISAVLELERGVPIWVEVRNGYGEFPKPLFVRFRDLDSGVTSRIGLGETGKRSSRRPRRRGSRRGPTSSVGFARRRSTASRRLTRSSCRRASRRPRSFRATRGRNRS
jgi:hypothetical protein